MSCWGGICKNKDEDGPILNPTIITDPKNSSLGRCHKLCSSYRSIYELEPPGKTVTACQYKDDGSCAYYTDPVKEWNTVALSYEASISSVDIDQCCVWIEGGYNVRCIRSTIASGNIYNFRRLYFMKNL